MITTCSKINTHFSIRFIYFPATLRGTTTIIIIITTIRQVLFSALFSRVSSSLLNTTLKLILCYAYIGAAGMTQFSLD